MLQPAVAVCWQLSAKKISTAAASAVTLRCGLTQQPRHRSGGELDLTCVFCYKGVMQGLTDSVTL